MTRTPEISLHIIVANPRIKHDVAFDVLSYLQSLDYRGPVHALLEGDAASYPLGFLESCVRTYSSEHLGLHTKAQVNPLKFNGCITHLFCSQEGLSIRLQLEEISALLTGDRDRIHTERMLASFINRTRELESDILHESHSGSDDSLAKAVNPKAIIIGGDPYKSESEGLLHPQEEKIFNYLNLF